MVSNRIKFIASLISLEDKVLDVGTDHALLPIYLIKNNLVKIADGSDISKNVLITAEKNVVKYGLEDRINLFCSDGVSNIDISLYNTLVITGMGFYTIKGILSNKNISSIKKMIIQANNNHEELRRFINQIGYKIIKDYYILDKNKPYLILLVEKGKQRLSKKEYICGLYDINNKWYYEYVINKYHKILKSVPKNERNIYENYIKIFSEYL